MPHIVKIIPGRTPDGSPIGQGTKVLLSNGEYLQGVHSIRIDIKSGDLWKAFIEVIPSKQDDAEALLEIINKDDK